MNVTKLYIICIYFIFILKYFNDLVLYEKIKIIILYIFKCNYTVNEFYNYSYYD